MLTAIHHPRRISAAQNRFCQRIRKELRTKIPDVAVGFQGGHLKVNEIVSNGKIWFAYQSLHDLDVPRHWNAFGAGSPALRRSNDITVEVNVAFREVYRKLAGVFAVNDKTGDTILLHRGKVGGGKKGIGKTAFLEWYSGDKVKFVDPSHELGEEEAIPVANLGSSRFLTQIESFVDAVHRFKAAHTADDPTQMSDDDLRKKATAAPAKPKSLTTVSVAYSRNRHVAELVKRRARGKCELCRKPAPFANASNEPYLESHHIVWLAHGGLDVPENTVALCPNCHRKMHVVSDTKDVVKLHRRAGAALPG